MQPKLASYGLAVAASEAPSLGARIRRARNLKRLSQQQLAIAVGASVRAVGSWERDRSTPRNLAVVEEFLGISPNGVPEPETYTDPVEKAVWEDPTLGTDDDRRAFIFDLRRAKREHARRTALPPAQ